VYEVVVYEIVVYEVVELRRKKDGGNGLYEVVVLWRKMGWLWCGGVAWVGGGAVAMGWERWRWWRRLVVAVMVVVVVVRGHSAECECYSGCFSVCVELFV